MVGHSCHLKLDLDERKRFRGRYYKINVFDKRILNVMLKRQLPQYKIVLQSVTRADIFFYLLYIIIYDILF